MNKKIKFCIKIFFILLLIFIGCLLLTKHAKIYAFSSLTNYSDIDCNPYPENKTNEKLASVRNNNGKFLNQYFSKDYNEKYQKIIGNLNKKEINFIKSCEKNLSKTIVNNKSVYKDNKNFLNYKKQNMFSFINDSRLKLSLFKKYIHPKFWFEFFHNLLSLNYIIEQLFGKDHLFKIIGKLTINEENRTKNVLAQTYTKTKIINNNFFRFIDINLTKKALNIFIIYKNFLKGFYSTGNISSILFHEVGHAISNYLNVKTKYKNNINNFTKFYEINTTKKN
ncbi:hypothetical protein NPX79_00855 [Spiroplasma endosymbiont of Anurida maritima]|uniref:hypothetical protein n=1 Tax=Spiroplasma endosymbiont of Anurida maritima TaxID=2967972 RepID=UPI0036D32701